LRSKKFAEGKPFRARRMSQCIEGLKEASRGRIMKKDLEKFMENLLNFI